MKKIQKQKKNYHHGDLKKALVDASIKIIQKGGYKSLSLRKASSVAGVSQAAPYRHYKDLESLYADIATRGFQMLSEKLKELREKYPNKPLIQFLKSGLIYISFATENPDLYRLMHGDKIENHSRFSELKEAEKESFSLLVSIIKDCIQIEKIQPEDPELLSLAAWSMVHGIAQFHLEKQLKFQELSDLDTHKLSSKLVQFLYAGMKA